MPIYEYRCGRCEQRTEVLLPTPRAPAPRCSACGSEEVSRVPSRFSVSGVPLTQRPATGAGGGCCGGGCGCGR